MNVKMLNTIPLDGGVIIKKGGGVPINNQDKVVDIVENGTTEVVADAGFTGLGKVTANVKVPSADIANDDKTRIYVEMSDNLEQEFSIILNDGCVASVDWGDGDKEQLSGDSMAHTYGKTGSYIIAIDVTTGTMGINTCGNKESVFRLEIGEGISLLGNNCFSNCENLKTLVFNGRDTELTLDMGVFSNSGIEELYIPENIVYKENSSGHFVSCGSLKTAVINNGSNVPLSSLNSCINLSNITFNKEIDIIESAAFLGSTSLKYLEIPAKQFLGGGFINNTNIEELSLPIVETIPGGAFSGVNSLKKVYIGSTLMTFPSGAFTAAAEFDLTDFTSVPTCQSGAFTAAEGLRIIVPEALYDEWKATEGWSDYADYIFRETNQEISSGGGSKWTGHADVEGLKAIGWTDEDIAYYQENGVNWNEDDDQYHLVSDDNKALYGVLTADNISTYADRIVYLPKIDTSGVTDMYQMFYKCYSLVSIPQLDTSSVTNMQRMFYSCYSLVSIPPLDTSSVTIMSEMFYNCYSLVSIPPLDTSSVKNLTYIFNNCYSLVSIPQLDTSSVTNTTYLFANCYSLVSIPPLDTSSVNNINNTFANCYSLTYANLKNQKIAVSFNGSALLSKESLLYIINNEASTSAFTITLKAYAYNRWATDADIVAALANHPNVSLASA